MSIEDALTKKILRSGQRFDMTEVVKDHLGNEYDNMLEMCKAYGVSPEAYYARCKKGKTGEALLAPMKPRGKRIVVDGVEYESIREYCRVTGFPYKTYLSRVKKGCDTIAALQGLHRSEWGRAVTDHLGNNFVNTTAMCAFHGVSLGTYISRLRYGWSMEEALRKRETVEFNGVVYNSIRHLSMAFGVDDNTVRARLKRGWDLERALGLSSNNKVEYVDHFGNRFATLLEMVAAHGVSVNTYKYRINHGYNLEESLSAELKRGKYAPARKAKRNKIRNEIEKRRTQIEMLQNEILELEKSCQSSRDEVVDSSGIVYSTYREMCAAHSVSYNSFLARKRRGCSMAECLSNVRLNQKSK